MRSTMAVTAAVALQCDGSPDRDEALPAVNVSEALDEGAVC